MLTASDQVPKNFPCVASATSLADTVTGRKGLPSLLFEHYIRFLAPWYDLSDSTLTFGIAVPALALDEPLLFSAAIALSAMHMCRVNGKKLRKTAESYHHRCVRLLIALNREDEHVFTGKALAAICLLRSYEILDGDTDPNVHLRGAYSMVSHQNALNLRTRSLLTAGFWNYLREDITFSLFEQCPLKMDLDPLTLIASHETDPDYLNSISLILGKIINIAFQRPLTEEEWEAAFSMTHEWIKARPDRLGPFSRRPAIVGTPSPLPSLYFLHESHGSTMHYYLVTLTILALHLPDGQRLDRLKAIDAFPRDNAPLSKQQFVHNIALDICGIAFSSKIPTVLVNAFGPMAYCARLINDEPARQELKRQLLACKKTIGWPVERLVGDLESAWKSPPGEPRV
ncbi:unnamed protein product [Clonostachys chloroleuca]|uniref:Uncharacterized protein n=1 Tax=Clonostachys chloroleuca TaxID=1926264 RepID=A0AA35M868_9HYPO|nr:unnamed protein product [Clonostachys chloroleuca]